MQIIEYFGKVENGKLLIRNRKAFDKELLQHEGKEVEITVKRKKKRRSHDQLSYHWGVLVPLFQRGLLDIGDERAISIEFVHKEIMTLFLFEEIVNLSTGEVKSMPKSLSDNGEVTTAEYSAALPLIQKYAIENLGVYIPDPNEQLEIS